MKIFWKIVLVVLGVLMVTNLGVLDREVFNSKIKDQRSKLDEITVAEPEDKTASPSCELSCQEIIEEKIQEELAKLPSPAGQSPVSTNGSKAKVVYVPLMNEGSVSSSSWTDIVPSEFYFNLADYPGAKEVRFEAFLSSANNDQGYGRIYDATNKRGVDFSDLSFAKSAYTRVESGAMVIWSGNNKYTVQLRSVNGTSVFLKDGKLKIIY